MRGIWNTSQPRPISSTPPTLGLVVAPLRALEDIEALALVSHAAAGAVDQRDDAIDIGIIGEMPDLLAASATKRATVAEQFTLVRMAM